MKFISHLFTVPKGEKVTEKAMKRVLLSSVCGILLCMCCLITSTWAWYTVNVQTGPLSVQVAEHKPQILQGTEWVNIGSENVITVEANVPQTVNLQFWTDAPVGQTSGVQSQNAPGRYIILIPVKEDVPGNCYWVKLTQADTNKQWTVSLTLTAQEQTTLKVATSWHAPSNGTQVDPAISPLTVEWTTGLLKGVRPTDPTGTTESSGATESTGTTGATEATGAAEATEATEATGATDTTESTKATDPTTIPEATEAPETGSQNVENQAGADAQANAG